MSISSSISAASAVKSAAAAVNNFQHRLMICLAHTLLNAIIIVRFFPVLYKATANEAFQQIGVSFALRCYARLAWADVVSGPDDPEPINRQPLPIPNWKAATDPNRQGVLLLRMVGARSAPACAKICILHVANYVQECMIAHTEEIELR